MRVFIKTQTKLKTNKFATFISALNEKGCNVFSEVTECILRNKYVVEAVITSDNVVVINECIYGSIALAKAINMLDENGVAKLAGAINSMYKDDKNMVE